MLINSSREWKAFKKKHREAIEKLNADPKEVEACMERLIKLNEEHEREGPNFIFKYLSAERILAALHANAQGLTITEMRDVFRPNQNDLGLDEHIHAALTVLEGRELAQRVSEQAGEGPAERWIARAQND